MLVTLVRPDNSVPWTNEAITVNGVTYNVFMYEEARTRTTCMFKKFDETLFIVFPPRYVIHYGDNIPELSEDSYSVYNTLGRTLSKPLKWSTEATNYSPVGGYEVVADMESVEENILLYSPAFINIRRAPLTVGVKDVTIMEGEEIPEFTLTYDGFKNNETDAVLITKPTATTTATSSSEAGTYPITVSGGEADNYSFAYVDGKLIVTEKASTITPLKGDVNEDGVVDVADIVAIIDIIMKGGGTSGETVYYWYVGRQDPNTMTSIIPLPSNDSSLGGGWRTIGTSLPEYSASNKLFDAQQQGSIDLTDMENPTFAIQYIIIPNACSAVPRDFGQDGTTTGLCTKWNNTITLNGVEYKVYQWNEEALGLGFDIY